MVHNKSNVDRTLVLRICDERLQARIREKMAALEEEETEKANSTAENSNIGSIQHGNFPQHQLGSTITATNPKLENKILDLAGVTIEPAPIQSFSDTSDATLWNFHCDGATYPARLTNLPCPVELHKTHDHAMYYKCADVAQMLIVYEDMTAMEEAETTPKYKNEKFPSYYHSGLTPPTSRIVEKRFAQRTHSPVPPPLDEIKKVEEELKALMDTISMKDTTKQKKNSKPTSNAIIEEVEEVVVQYEPWMDDNGNKPDGIQFDEKDEICLQHPEVWLDPEDMREETGSSTAVMAPDAQKFGMDETKKKKKKSKKKKDSVATNASETEQNHSQSVAGETHHLDLVDLNMETLEMEDFDDFGLDFEGLDNDNFM